MISGTNSQKEEASEVYLCSGCGGNMEYDISSQKLKCPYCGTEEDIRGDSSLVKEYDFQDVAVRESDSNWNEEVSMITCESCGAQTIVDKHQTALYCSYCGSSHVLESKQSAGIKPEGIIPFKIEKHKAKESFDKWIKRRWLAPGKLKQLYQSDKLMPVYIPYWTYDAQTYNRYSAQGGKYYYVQVERNGKKEMEQRIRWYPVSGQFSKFFDDVQVNGSKNYDESLMNKIEPYNTFEVEPYKPQYISGYMAERYSRDVIECFEYAKNKMYNELVREVEIIVTRRYDTVSSIHINTSYEDVKYKHVLLPLWTAQYDYNGKEYRYMINGQNGRVSGEYPLSPIKIILLVILALGAIVTFLYFQGYFNDDLSQAGEIYEYIALTFNQYVS